MASEPSERVAGRKCTLSVCLITRNEAHRLPSALESVAGVADEIVVADTGSTDDTVSVARRMGATVIEISWRDDFSQARNASLEAAGGDWILCLDADETLAPGQERKLRRLLSGRADAHYVQIRSPLTGRQAGQTFIHAFPRLFRNRPEFRYQGRVHEQINPALERAAAQIGFADLILHHTGYETGGAVSEAKLRRNRDLLRRDLGDRPDDALVHYFLGETYALLDEPTKAELSYRRALEIGGLSRSHTASAHQNLASVLLRLGEYGQAAHEAEQARAVDPGALVALLIHGSAQCRKGEHTSAIRSVDRYLKECRRRARDRTALMGFAPDLARAYLIRGESHLRRGTLPEARRDATKVLEMNRQWPGGHRLMARVAKAEGDLRRAEEHLRAALELDPRDAPTWRNLAMLQAERGEPSRGLETIEMALGEFRQAELYECQGWLRIKMEDFHGGIESYRRALELKPASAEIHRRLAGLHHKLGDVDQAKEHLMRFEAAKQGSGAPSGAPS